MAEPQKPQTDDIDISAGLVPRDDIDLSAGITNKKKPESTAQFAPQKQPESGVFNRIGQFFAGGVDQPINAIRHPIQTVESMGLPGLMGSSGSGYPSIGPTANKATDIANIGRKENALAQQTQQGGEMMREHPAYMAGALSLPLMAAHAATRPVAPSIPPNPTETITNAFNPAAKQMPLMERNVTPENLGTLQDYARRTNLPLETRADFVKAAEGAANEREAFYNDKVLGPASQQRVSVRNIPNYGGDYFPGETPQATLEQLENRLRTVNKMSKGNIEADKVAPLQAEAEGIRKILYPSLAQFHGIAPEEVANLRHDFGQLGDLATKGRTALNVERRAANLQARKPLTLNPFSSTKKFVADPLVSALGQKYREFKGTTPDAMLRGVLNQEYSSSPFPAVRPAVESPAMERPAYTNPDLIEYIKRKQAQRSE